MPAGTELRQQGGEITHHGLRGACSEASSIGDGETTPIDAFIPATSASSISCRRLSLRSSEVRHRRGPVARHIDQTAAHRQAVSSFAASPPRSAAPRSILSSFGSLRFDLGFPLTGASSRGAQQTTPSSMRQIAKTPQLLSASAPASLKSEIRAVHRRRSSIITSSAKARRSRRRCGSRRLRRA